ncbi:hypothetical protein ACFV5G_16990 [Streptomyces sp. NPDC059766]|uniref:hypothetical protein n=1 Tax=Streptomyces sp. NPDC059766 TaxID=3346940 RepID=UPI003669DFE9
MSADEVTHETGADASLVRTGPRHAAPKKPLFTRFQVPAGKAMAIAAMPTAVLMGMGLTPTLARADEQPASKSMSAEEYKDCVKAMADSTASATPSASASATESADSAKGDAKDSAAKSSDSSDGSGKSDTSGKPSSSDSGSDGKAEPAPSQTSAASDTPASGGDTATPAPSASAAGGNLLETIGDTLKDVLTGGKSDTASATPTPTASATAAGTADTSASDKSDKSASDTVKATTKKAVDTVDDTATKAADTASEAAGDTEKADDQGKDEGSATPSASPSPSSSTDVADCPVATEDESGVDNKLPLPADPWYLSASGLTLKGASYKGIVEVKTADGKKKKVLKYVISGGTDIVDLHQTVKDKTSGHTYHVQGAKGSTSTIKDGDTVMYTESISGNLFGLIPVTFSPDSPPPLDIPLIYFSDAKVVQAGQFGGTLTIPGMRNYID